MKNFVAVISVLAATGLTLGAAAYYLYKKDQELSDYEDLLYGKDDEIDEEETEDEFKAAEDRLQDVISDIKDATDELSQKASTATVRTIDKVTEALEEIKKSIIENADKEAPEEISEKEIDDEDSGEE
jgi:hypothetical protein